MNVDFLEKRLCAWLMRRTTDASTRRVADLPISMGTDLGLIRKDNQDRVIVARSQLRAGNTLTLVALSDGMGGMTEGAACASLSLSTLVSVCLSDGDWPLQRRLMLACHEANKRVYEAYGGGGGATLSVFAIDSREGGIAFNVGDSRIYTYDGKLSQLSIDDTLEGQLPNRGMSDGLRRNEILQYIGMGDGLQPHAIELPASTDYMILTSDGVHYVDKGTIRAIISNGIDAGIVVKRLLDLSKWCGGHDNASMAIVALQDLVQKSDQSDVIQVWDPFGEVQFFSPRYALSSSERVSKYNVEPAAIKPPGKKAKKKQPPRKNTSEMAAEKTPIKQERPQLKIDFDDGSDEEPDA